MSGMNPFNSPFGAHPHIQQGTPIQGPPLSMAGSPQEEIRNQIMRRVGQYGPQPLHRTRGAIGGQNPALDKAEWKLLLRDDQWHDDATGPFNANFKTLVAQSPPSVLYAANGNALGMIVRLSFGVGGTTNNELYYDVPANGMVHVPFCGETVIAHVGLEVKIYPGTLLPPGGPSLWQPDNPTLVAPNAANSGFNATHPPQASGAIVPGQGLATNPNNMPTRQVGVLLTAGGATGFDAEIPIPRGSQAVQVIGPADVTAAMSTPRTNAEPHQVALVPGQVTPLFSTAESILISSAADGGVALLYFYLGI